MKRPHLRRPVGYSILALLSALLGVTTPPASASKDSEDRLLDFERPFAEGIRGITVGPIENTLHSDKGYGSDASARTFELSRRLGANWVSLTPFGRAWDLTPSGVDLRFEAQFSDNRRNVIAAIRQAHDQGLKVLLVPHLWVETGEWRALIHFDNDQEWKRWFEAYRVFLLTWAAVAQEANVNLFSAGVEWRSWVTTTRAPSFAKLLREVKQIYRGPITYAANWDDVDHTVILGELDVIGINAFYPLTDKQDASMAELLRGGAQLIERVKRLALEWRKPVLFTEIGYTTRPDPALRPWEWPDGMRHVTVDGPAQAEAYLALLHRFLQEPWFLGFFVWRNYADPYDTSQEAPWGFTPLHKPAELVMRDAFAQGFAYEGPSTVGRALASPGATRIGSY